MIVTQTKIAGKCWSWAITNDKLPKSKWLPLQIDSSG